MRIGTVEIPGRVVVAPMAGVTDLAYRTICRELGAHYTVTEMVSAKALCYGDKKTPALLKLGEGEHPVAAQIFGSEPEFMAKGAQIALQHCDADIIDINMGCPAPKIVKNGDGCSLMRDEILAGKIAESVVEAVSIPVSVKFRAGWDSDSINAVSFAKVMENSGVSCVTVHGRTKDQFYSGFADYNIIKDVRDSVKIPVVANGDVTDAASAKNILSKTNCNSLMVGRGSLGNPFIFAEIKAAFEGNSITCVSAAQKRKALLRHIELMEEYKAEHIGVPEMRKHFAWYLKGVPHSGKYKLEAFAAKTYKEMKNLAIQIF